MTLDSAILTSIVQLRTPWLDDVMVFATAVGRAGFLWLVLSAVGFIFPDRRAAAWRLLLVIGFTYLVVDICMKPLFDRSRPFEVMAIQLIDQRPTSGSFPSGHAAWAFAGALAGSRLFPAAAWGLWPAAGLIAFSRVYLGVHWPSDIVVGAVVGLACAWFVLGGRSLERSAHDT